MRRLSDEELKKAYFQAKELGLDPEFIQQLEAALNRRLINIHKGVQQKTKESLP
ncbi:sporulation histidine kinase inhibitor Sda [Sporosarcina sp. 6E9]|uniref:sporulation histidine kinase inhibitor Sda n=1 Tax=Sporosarcina sp. 6E9 TaxID=2819235 RepID=UPI001B3124BE|nr:sporulation histidine kinase inhibitor Sda [Sporosarcina sp. 6E9]